ncbi:hypothetical protein TSOC_012566 [Tetrabaena socialis]|uniref:Uncharacterized protein n=1 Tax=Tetrabaena socialis TaxID=47790 RepID=A0A2J7ZMP4_9CHLO|nr:hypothetical protein TSOC_012566 [Tetrabaena socialis]|eukprot:PNH01542.1 hypothetical protein TSOC_012566 [Tetrabaena socialis]
MSQLQEAVASAIAAVLANASGAGPALARTLPPLRPAGEDAAAPAAATGLSSGHMLQDPSADGAVQLAVAAVLSNAQRHAPALGAASAGSVAAKRSRTQLCLQPAARTAGPPAQPPHDQPLRVVRAAGDTLPTAAEEPIAGRRGRGRREQGQDGEEPGLSARPSDIGVVSRSREKWRLEEIQVLLQHLEGLSPNVRNLSSREAMHKLVKTAKVKPYTYNWRAWLRRAFMTFPDLTGTLDDAAAFIEADPSIAPLLDRRPEPDRLDVPRWKRSMTKMRFLYPKFEATGERRGFHYLAEDLAVRKSKAPKHGDAGPATSGQGVVRRGQKSG